MSQTQVLEQTGEEEREKESTEQQPTFLKWGKRIKNSGLEAGTSPVLGGPHQLSPFPAGPNEPAQGPDSAPAWTWQLCVAGGATELL